MSYIILDAKRSAALAAFNRCGLWQNTSAEYDSPVRREGSVYYREQAKRCRELAERQSEADVKARLLEVAQQYEELTENAEARGE
ncbi:MAG TPA: hypothetical protein VFH89_03575 [Sphingomicrobium sp.]|nr:hypothetical protein [Sphingomicrobium sp.]